MQEPATSKLSRRGPALAVIFLAGTTAISLGYLVHERDRVQELTAGRDQAQAAIAQTRAQVDELNAKITALVARPQPSPADVDRASGAVAPARRISASDPRVNRLQTQLASNTKQLATTQEELKKAREELQGNLNSTREELNGSITRNREELDGSIARSRDELSGSLTRSHAELSTSIARSHDELVELQKRGERNYYEFQIAKSKKFQRTGPLALSLRKADVKHKRFDLKMLVDDSELEKKRVNLYEPVMVYLPSHPQPLELVVNQIDKDSIKGYLSEPKYKKSDLAASAAPKPQQLTTRQ